MRTNHIFFFRALGNGNNTGNVIHPRSDRHKVKRIPNAREVIGPAGQE